MSKKDDTKAAEAPEKKNTYITLHKNFVRENIEYADKKTGEKKTFNSVTLPSDTIIGDKDVSGYQFSPRFVNESKYRGENYRDIPLLTDREVWLQKSVMDAEGNRVTDENGRNVKDTVKVMPAQIKTALAEAYERYKASKDEPEKGEQEKAEKGRDEQSLSERAQAAKEGSAAIADKDIPFDEKAR